MSDVTNAPWTRRSDWVSLAAGAYLTLSPLWVDGGPITAGAMVIIGVVIARLALESLALPGAVIDEWITAVAGVVAFTAPWVFSYAAEASGAAWTSWTVGLTVVVSALLAVPDSREVFRRQHTA